MRTPSLHTLPVIIYLQVLHKPCLRLEHQLLFSSPFCHLVYSCHLFNVKLRTLRPPAQSRTTHCAKGGILTNAFKFTLAFCIIPETSPYRTLLGDKSSQSPIIPTRIRMVPPPLHLNPWSHFRHLRKRNLA